MHFCVFADFFKLDKISFCWFLCLYNEETIKYFILILDDSFLFLFCFFINKEFMFLTYLPEFIFVSPPSTLSDYFFVDL